MTIHPKDILLPAFRPRLPPPRMTEDDTLLVQIAELCAKAQNVARLRQPLVSLLGEIVRETMLEETSRKHPGLVGVLCPETA